MMHCRSTDKLVHVIDPKPHLLVVHSAHIDLGEDVLKAGVLSLLIDVIHATRNVEKRDHFFDILVHHECVGFARRLKNVVTGSCNPVVLQVSPGAFNYVAMDRSGMSMAAKNPSATYSQQVAPLPV